MDIMEQGLYQDVVKLVNRTDKELNFMYDSRTFYVKPDKPLVVPRFIAEYGITKWHTKLDPLTGLPETSLLGIDGDEGWPIDKIKDVNPNEVLDSEKMGPNPNNINMKRGPGRPKLDKADISTKENFAGNNVE